MRRGLKVFVLAVLVLLMACAGGVIGAFIMRNSAWVVVRVPAIHFGGPKWIGTIAYEAQLSWLLLGTFAAGVAAVVLFVVVPTWLRRCYGCRRDARVIAGLRGELADLRSMPLTHPAPLEDIDEANELDPEASSQKGQPLLPAKTPAAGKKS